jgi:hypothetical protein
MLDEAADEIAPADGLSIERPTCASTSAAAPGSPGQVTVGNSIDFLPFTSSSVLLVMDEDGYLTPLLTAGALLRLCKAKWRAEG